MHKLLVLGCLSVIMLAAACQEHTDGDLPQTKKTAPLVPPDSATFKTPKFGISTANATHEYELAAGTALLLKGWIAADEQLTVTYDLNGQKAQTTSETRNDVKNNHPDYKHVQGWLIAVPANKLKAENNLVIQYGDNSWPMTVKVK